ncbi:uncharacterized protein B0I36DRAFT_324226 [Microdochium trichocladiopsis]|uniref:Uncharacterized protein n=1 Tax=Microdochium trichocladiopsis TaxID=1682393 RepID=A0A9P8Y5I3_9PEZI|nr:uncharacterized protein B0I36DRAFT_324226 [Microdochium trichocladiopsis]KAH7031582.1 hypothetical protein B0I36DRAFT_324226 [Microdochium trichocladiopsis]
MILRTTLRPARLLARCATRRHLSTRPTPTSKFSVLLDSPQASKDKVLLELAKHVTSARNAVTGTEDCTAIVASQDYAAWLQDESFMSCLLGLLSVSDEGNALSRKLDVLTAVSDGIGSPYGLDDPQKGFSFLSGSRDILPSLWDAESFTGSREPNQAAALTFLGNPIEGHSRPLEITLPLANTIFQNGRRSTLFASEWHRDGDGPMRLGKREFKQSQRIFTHNTSMHSTATIPLMPLAPPRKIVTGLGNIVRQVEIDGAPAPASKELEALIPQLFETRGAAGISPPSGPIGVWAWVIPPHVVEAEELSEVACFSGGSIANEADAALDMSTRADRMLAAGCRLHRILSGGGGWGAKQGLLSLDPETSYAQPEQNDIDAFVKAFEERNSAEPSSGLVSPGSYVLFCVEPYLTTEQKRSLKLPPILSLGVSPHAEDTQHSLSEGPGKIRILDGYMGIQSAAGLFVKALPEVDGRGTGKAASLTTRINVPRSFLVPGIV